MSRETSDIVLCEGLPTTGGFYDLKYAPIENIDWEAMPPDWELPYNCEIKSEVLFIEGKDWNLICLKKQAPSFQLSETATGSKLTQTFTGEVCYDTLEIKRAITELCRDNPRYIICGRNRQNDTVIIGTQSNPVQFTANKIRQAGKNGQAKYTFTFSRTTAKGNFAPYYNY